MKETTGMPDSMGMNAEGDPHAVEGRRGPTWRAWALSILVAILLSVTATLLLGGMNPFRLDGAAGNAAAGGSGGPCCPQPAK